jgi:hypothetical protein
MSNTASYFPVTPSVTDPDAQIAAGGNVRRGGSPDSRELDYAQPHGYPHSGDHGAPPQPSKGFFQEHRFAIIVAIIVLGIIIVVLYMYLTRKGDKKKKALREEEAEPPNGTQLERMFYGRGSPPGNAPAGAEGGSEGVDLEELSRLRELRRKAKAPGADSEFGAPEDAAGAVGMQAGRSVTVTTVGIAIPRPQQGPGMRPSEQSPAGQASRPPPSTPPAKPRKVTSQPQGAKPQAGTGTPGSILNAAVDHPAPRPAQPRQPQSQLRQQVKPPPQAHPPHQPKPQSKALPPATVADLPVVPPAVAHIQPAAQAAIDDDDTHNDDSFDISDVYQGAIPNMPSSSSEHDDMDTLIGSLGVEN